MNLGRYEWMNSWIRIYHGLNHWADRDPPHGVPPVTTSKGREEKLEVLQKWVNMDVPALAMATVKAGGRCGGHGDSAWCLWLQPHYTVTREDVEIFREGLGFHTWLMIGINLWPWLPGNPPSPSKSTPAQRRIANELLVGLQIPHDQLKSS